MSSGNDTSSTSLDRILKLWISLWNLILENKRNYESVCAILQRLVFEKTEWPKFKNWPAICELGRTEPLMRNIIQKLDLSVISERNARVIAAFADCFSLIKVSGIPLSLICEQIAKVKHEDPAGTGNTYDEDLNAVKDGTSLWVDRWTIESIGLPIIFLFDQGLDLNEVEDDLLHNVPKFICPDGISSKNTQCWTSIVFQNKLYTVVEVEFGDAKRITLVPAEYIALDL